MNPNKIVGAGNNRSKYDFYPTPSDVTEGLLQVLNGCFVCDIIKTVWEPAAGTGSITKVLEEHGLKVISTDIQSGHNFLTDDAPAEYDMIITNPPFSLADQFIRKAYSYGKPFAFLLKCQFFHAKKRYKLFEECRPSMIFPLTWRPDFTGGGSSLMDMMWVVWIGKTKYTFYNPIGRKEISKNDAKRR